MEAKCSCGVSIQKKTGEVEWNGNKKYRLGKTQATQLRSWDIPSNFVSPDEVLPVESFVEGAISQIRVNAFERNAKARRQCITIHGTSCCICGFVFGAAYGPDADGYIRVHHLRPLSEVGGQYVVDPIADLRPVCPNCHAVLHLGGRCRTIEEVKQLLSSNRPVNFTLEDSMSSHYVVSSGDVLCGHVP